MVYCQAGKAAGKTRRDQGLDDASRRIRYTEDGQAAFSYAEWKVKQAS